MEEITMSGHSKWNNRKHKKEKSDAQKAKQAVQTLKLTDV